MCLYKVVLVAASWMLFEASGGKSLVMLSRNLHLSTEDESLTTETTTPAPLDTVKQKPKINICPLILNEKKSFLWYCFADNFCFVKWSLFLLISNIIIYSMMWDREECIDNCANLIKLVDWSVVEDPSENLRTWRWNSSLDWWHQSCGEIFWHFWQTKHKQK